MCCADDKGTAVRQEKRMNEKEIKEKLKAYAEILDSLYTSGIVRTYNSPVGDYTEWLVSNKLGLELQNNSAAGFDALDKENGLRYQIKGRWVNPKNQRKQLSVIRDYEKFPFDYLIAVIFSFDFEITEAYLIPYEIIKKYFSYNKHLNGILITLTNKLISDPQVKDIKSKLM